MERTDKKRALSLGMRVGAVFLITVAAVFMAAHYILSQNIQGLFTDYTIKLIESMASQGVNMVSNEVDAGKQEALFLAGSFTVPKSGEPVEFPRPYEKSGYLRVVYVTESGTVSSDGRQLDVREREDIQGAFAGRIGMYGPYFNEENEYVVCYSSPVWKEDNVVGVLSVEKDGYRFCDIIKDIRFGDTGESYIINAEGTDIAVSDSNHIDWVNTQYNAQQIYSAQEDEETRSILELERRGLNGETGVGTYFWNDGLVYVFYQPVPSTGWVLLAGLREEELNSMTQGAILAAVSDGPVLMFCLLLVLFLTALIVWWIVSSMKQSAAINQRLKFIANYDSLTGLMNRNSYHAALDTMAGSDGVFEACIYIDANGLHELNNHLGHQAGDRMLQAVADVLRSAFLENEIYRIGGDEFVVLCQNGQEEDIRRCVEQVRKILHGQSYDISVGIALKKDESNAMDIINKAEAAMQQDKKWFYENSDNERRMRALDKKTAQIIEEKRDADAFLEFLAPEFNGVYFVNMSRDTVRHIFIPPYFEVCLREADNRFSKALLLYAKRIVRPEYYRKFEELCDYTKLEKLLDSGGQPEFVYQKLNGEWLNLKILKFRDYTMEERETLWVFAGMDNPEE